MNPNLFSSLAIASNRSNFTPEELKQEGIDRAEEHVNPEWKQKLKEVIVDLCVTQREWTADNVRERMKDDEPVSDAAYGAIISKMSKDKKAIFKFGEYVRSKRKDAHGHIVVKWISLII